MCSPTPRSALRWGAGAGCTSSTGCARTRSRTTTSPGITALSPRRRGKLSASGPRAICWTSGRRPCSRAGRRTRSCSSCCRTRSSATGRYLSGRLAEREGERRSTSPMRSAACSRRSSRGCTGSSTPACTSSSSSAVGATRWGAPSRARLPRRPRPRVRPGGATAQGRGRPESLPVAVRSLRLGLPEGTRHRLMARLGRPVERRARGAVAGHRGIVPHRARPGGRGARRDRAGLRRVAVAELRASGRGGSGRLNRLPILSPTPGRACRAPGRSGRRAAPPVATAPRAGQPAAGGRRARTRAGPRIALELLHPAHPVEVGRRCVRQPLQPARRGAQVALDVRQAGGSRRGDEPGCTSRRSWRSTSSRAGSSAGARASGFAPHSASSCRLSPNAPSYVI